MLVHLMQTIMTFDPSTLGTSFTLIKFDTIMKMFIVIMTDTIVLRYYSATSS